ncbi:MAG: ribbon-helix-helix domain-containing protein [Gammaproteobacteria bacterium]
MAMFTEKLSISLPAPLVRFVEQYRSTHRCRTRSQVFEEALELLRTRELEQAYREAEQERDAAWEVTAADGLNDEAW